MSIMSREVTGAELANVLAVKLSDLEFELLIRQRIKLMLAAAHAANPNLSESHDSVRFLFDGRDSSKWTVGIGETYSKSKSAEGEVLSATASDVQRMMDMYATNKMSLLLAPPAAQSNQAYVPGSAVNSIASDSADMQF